MCTPPAMTCRAEGPRELRDRAVFALYGDADERLWAGAAGLLFRYDGRSWTSFPPSSGAPEATVRAFASTRDGALWMGTNGGGLARYRDGTFTRVTRRGRAAERPDSIALRGLRTGGSGSAPKDAGWRGSIRARWRRPTPAKPRSSGSARRTGSSMRSSTRSSRTTPVASG